MKVKNKRIRLTIIGTIFIVIISIVLLSISYCKKANLWHYEIPEHSWEIEVSASDGTMKIHEAAAIFAQLTSEDGTGEINLNMTWQEITQVLDEKGILYEIYEEPDGYKSVFTADGTDYCTGINAHFKLHKTKGGLACFEPASRAKELYGKPDLVRKYDGYDNVFYYEYNMGKIYCNLTDSQRTVALTLDVADDIVTHITIRFLTEDEEGKLFKKGWF